MNDIPTTTSDPAAPAVSGRRRRPGRRVVSLWLNRFATDRAARRQAGHGAPKPNGWPSRPLATVAAERGGQVLAAVSEAAAGAGLGPGQPLADARALCPHLETAEADPASDARALAALADGCGRYTPWTAVDTEPGGPGSGGVWLDISGCGHLFGSEATLLADLAAYMEQLGYTHRLAVADTPGAAWAAARFMTTETGIASVPADGQAKVLSALPVAALRLPAAVLEGLQRMGLRRIGDLIGLPRAPLAARFGAVVLDRLDQALGHRPETIEPRRPAAAFRARLAFAEPINHRGGIDAVLDRLLAALSKQLADARQGARRLALMGYRTDGSVAEIAVGTGRPVRDPGHLAKLFREKLELFDPGFGIEVAVLAAVRTDPLAPVQAPLRAADGGAGKDLDYLLDRLGNRLGPERVLRLAGRERHLPEYAAKAVSALDGPPSLPSGAGGPAAPRPLRLLPAPEPIQVMAPVPDRPPVLFRWRHRPYRVARADGPERIAPEWWREDPSALFSGEAEARDYYRIEDETGARFWVYRQGLYRPDRPPYWFLHGFFA